MTTSSGFMRDGFGKTSYRRVMLGLAGTLAASALAWSISLGGGGAQAAYADEAAFADVDAAVALADGDIALAERVAVQVLPSVGSVYASLDDGYRRGLSTGSCEVLNADGHILTNYHVVENAASIQVVIGDAVFDAALVGADPTSDVAVLKIEPGETALVPIAIGDSSSVVVGEWVMTVGTPYGASGSVSSGIVSALDRTSAMRLASTDAYYVGMIQTDAMINSGSSGGALVNADGEFIGMTTLSTSSSGDWAGMSYAIPSNYAIDIANQIIATGTAVHPQLGVSVANLLDAYYQGAYAMGATDASVLGAYVSAVVAGSGAEVAGVQVGDVIVKVNGDDVYSADDLIIKVRSHAIGDTVTLAVRRGSEPLEVPVVLGSDADVLGQVAEGTPTQGGADGLSYVAGQEDGQVGSGQSELEPAPEAAA